jgi:AGZA family xanthine/uracil permease-like MFS transporter
MIGPIRKVQWEDFETSIPAFLSMILIPLTYSITLGIVWGFLSYTALKALQGKFRQISPTLWIIDLFAILSLVYGK